ncbi:MAG: hypothetical protein GXY67_07980 [Clostridiales bacterium]|nr:hypothetical protein [Clostridiales bacterium]
MALEYAYTLQEAQEQLALWKDCLTALATGQAKSYRIGSREFTAFDIPAVNKQIMILSNAVKVLSGNARKSRVVRVVPRDL